MARTAEGKDIFVNELAIAYIDVLGDVGLVVPVRWFRRGDILLSRAYTVRTSLATNGDRKLVIDVRESKMREIPLTAYILNVEDLCDPSVQQRWRLPPPDHIEGTLYVLSVSSVC